MVLVKLLVLFLSLRQFVTTRVVCDEPVITVFLPAVITASSKTCQPWCAVIIMMNAIMNQLSVLFYTVSMMLEKALESLYRSTAVESVGIRLVL